MTYQADLSGLIGSYLSAGEMSEAEPGIYTGQLTIQNSPLFSVEDVKLALEDQGVYRATY